MNIKEELKSVIGMIKRNHDISFFEDKEQYLDWLAQTYFFVVHSTSLLGYCLPHLKNQQLRYHFEHHLSEESRHDLIVLKDLEKAGRHISDYQEYACTQAFYQSQYYRISFENGTSLLGYILFLEGIAVLWGGEVHQRIKTIHQHSDLFLKVHAQEDPAHLDSAIKVIHSLPVEEQKDILKNLYYSYEMYNEILNKIKASKAKKIAA